MHPRDVRAPAGEALRQAALTRPAIELLARLRGGIDRSTLQLAAIVGLPVLFASDGIDRSRGWQALYPAAGRCFVLFEPLQAEALPVGDYLSTRTDNRSRPSQGWSERRGSPAWCQPPGALPRPEDGLLVPRGEGRGNLSRPRHRHDDAPARGRTGRPGRAGEGDTGGVHPVGCALPVFSWGPGSRLANDPHRHHDLPLQASAEEPPLSPVSRVRDQVARRGAKTPEVTNPRAG